ncbi:MAG: PepSY domain-containing protein [Flavobacteriaceae bacterium]|nr:PepSY domain-containing protein [Flavobacteriaceae bacterium]
MTISIWRYSHLALAISSSVFILLASLTGIILAAQPISEQLQPYKVELLDTISLAETITTLQASYTEIIEIKRDHNDFIIASVFTEDGTNIDGYFNPLTAEYLGPVIEPSPFFKWVTSLHRSLFLKRTGRILVGISSFLLFLIATTGTLLILKRQKRFITFFSKIVKDDFSQYWHIVLGRLSLIPILIITITGVYLSLEKFKVSQKENSSHTINYDTIKSTPKLDIKDFEVFKTHSLLDLKSIEFPFSQAIEDVFTLQLNTSNLIINQYTGEVISEVKTPTTQLLSSLSLNLHTGRGNGIWAIILAIASVNILFFIYSGFTMTLKRRSSRVKNSCTFSEAEYIILVGSENGSTNRFANAFYKALITQNKSTHITEMNAYKPHPKLKHLIVFTATYGQGEAPSNAKHFIKLVHQTAPNNAISFSVLGFGSLSYANFCQYALDVDTALNGKFYQLIKPYTINDKSLEVFKQWVRAWSKAIALDINIPENIINTSPKRLKKFKITGKTNANEQVDNTFLIHLKPKTYTHFSSGDLLAIYPKNDHRERLYSIGKINKKLQLSIKLHSKGIGSNTLYNLDIGDTLKARIIRNKAFHMPQKSKSIIMIANGTGIAPFLGMIAQNKAKDIHLYFGQKTTASKTLYYQQLQSALQANKLKAIHYAISRAENKCYVQDLILKDHIHIMHTLNRNGTIMICGSLAMYKEVIKVLQQIISNHLSSNLNDYINNGQITSDCY